LSTPKAWSAEVRAPVSILALMRAMPSPGSATHSRQPTMILGGLATISLADLPSAELRGGTSGLTRSPPGCRPHPAGRSPGESETVRSRDRYSDWYAGTEARYCPPPGAA